MQTFVPKPERLRTFREELTRLQRNRKLTQADLAKLCGISVPTLKRYMDDPFSMPMGFVGTFAHALDANKDDTDLLWDAVRRDLYKEYDRRDQRRLYGKDN